MICDYHLSYILLTSCPKDSTCFQIDESLAEYYPGSGGSGSDASVRIQFEYDILSGKINDLSLNSFNDQDAKDSVATIELTEHGDLIIRDLPRWPL